MDGSTLPAQPDERTVTVDISVELTQDGFAVASVECMAVVAEDHCGNAEIVEHRVYPIGESDPVKARTLRTSRIGHTLADDIVNAMDREWARDPKLLQRAQDKLGEIASEDRYWSGRAA